MGRQSGNTGFVRKEWGGGWGLELRYPSNTSHTILPELHKALAQVGEATGTLVDNS
jgi:hypothetical protein